MKQLMEEREGYYFEIHFNKETKALTSRASIPFGLMAQGIGATLSRLNLTSEEFNSFMFGLVKEFEASNQEKRRQDNE